MSGNKKGFTLIELLIVVVIIGILAAIAIPKFANTKEKAYVAAMKSDLRNLATYEEQYAADNNGAYFSGTATSPASMQGFTPSGNVTITATAAVAPASWSGEASHSQTDQTCTMVDGVIACVDPSP
jgi:type IV pilus assembly protein PilA